MFKHFSIMVFAVLFCLVSGTVKAEKKPLDERFFYRPFRIGVCGGYTPECQFASTKIEFTSRYVGFNIHIGAIPAWFGATLKTYPTPTYNVNKTTFRPYAFYGGAGTFGSSISGGGVGTDIHFFDSKRLMLQPAIAVFNQSLSQMQGPQVTESTDRVTAGGSLSVMAAF